MVIDKLENFEQYVALNPLFAVVARYLKEHDLHQMEAGKTPIQGDEVILNIAVTKPKGKEQAKLEAHRDYIDVQVPLSDTEVMGYTPTADCQPQDAPFDAENDIIFYEGLAENYLEVKPGLFTIFFPEDGHAPGVSPTGLKKAIFKVKVS